MPPRYAYWTIIAGGLPTAFRAADRDELMPTFQRIKEKHPDAVMKWFARGKLWESQEAARAAERRGGAPPHDDANRHRHAGDRERPRGATADRNRGDRRGGPSGPRKEDSRRRTVRAPQGKTGAGWGARR